MISLAYYDTTVLALGALFLGIIMLIKGGAWTVDSGVYVARRFGISPMVVGFTIIAFGTSFPELVVSVVANLQGSPGITLGNVLGSNIANILMVLGCTAILIDVKVKPTRPLIRDLVFMIFATVGLIIALKVGGVSRIAGLSMIAILGAYIFYQYKTTKQEEYVPGEMDEVIFKSDIIAYALLLLGLVCIAVGAEFLVKGAKVSAGLMGVPESVIALSIIAFGTSLPEFTTSIIAARKGQTAMVVGNIVGSNVFNILMIIGFSSVVQPISSSAFSPQIQAFDVWVTLAVSMVLVVLLLLRGKIDRITGSLFFLMYIAYNIYIYAVSMSA